MSLGSMEKSMFLRSEAQRSCPKPAVPLHMPTLAQCHPHPALLHMEWYGPGTPLGSQQSIHHLIQLANSFQTSARIPPGVWRKARDCRSDCLLSEFTAAHTPSAPCSLTGLPHPKQLPSHLSSSYGFSFCPRAQQAMLLNWTCVYKSWRACL